MQLKLATQTKMGIQYRGLQWPDCVWRRIFAAAGDSEESRVGEQSHRTHLGEVNYIDSASGTLVALRTRRKMPGAQSS